MRIIRIRHLLLTGVFASLMGVLVIMMRSNDILNAQLPASTDFPQTIDVASSSDQSKAPTIHRVNRVAPDIQNPPLKLSIPRLNINAPIIPVGLMPTGAMGIPKNPFEAGWFMQGTRPGEQGSAVIAGHLDTVFGDAAIFARLHELHTGDEIQVTNADGQTVNFKVIENRIYEETDTAALAYIYGDRSAKRLNLITCAGDWQKGKKTYTERRVVFAELVNRN